MPSAAAAELPAWATLASANQIAQLRNGLAYLLNDEADGQRVADVLKRLEGDTGPGLVPWIAGRSVLHAAAVFKALNEPPSADAPSGEQTSLETPA
jgi:hypothetical protein